MSRSQRRRPGRLYTLLAALVSLGLVIGACLAAASLYLDSEAFKSELSETLSGLLGREVALKGDLGVSVYPWLGVETGPVEIRDGRDFGLESFISARGVAAAVKLLPLVSGEVVLSTVTVKGMEVNLVRLADGRTNWGDLFSFLSPGPGQAKPVESAEALKVSVLGLKLEDASFSFRDDRLGQRYRLSGVDLSTGMFVPGEPLAFSLDFDFRTRLLKLAAGVRLQGSLETGNRAGAIDKAVLHVLLGGRFLPDSSPKAEFLANLDFDPWAQTLALSDFRMKTLGLDLSGYFKGERIFENPAAEGRLEIKPFDPRQLAGLFFKDAFKDAPKDVLRRAAFCAELSVNDKSADFKDLTLVLDDTRISGSISSKGFFRQPDYVFDLRVDQLDLDRYIPLFITPEPFVIGDFFPDLFHGLRAEGRIEVAALRLMARDLGRVGLGLVSGPDGARLSLDPVKALGGSLSAELKGLVGPAQDEARTVLLSAALKIAGAEAKALPLARDLGLSGRANLDLSLSMPGTAFRLKDPALMALARTSAVLDLALAQGAVAPAKSWPGLEFSKARLTARLKPDMGLTPGNDLAYVVALDLSCAGRAPGRSFAAELNGPALTDGDFKTLKLKAAALKASQKGGLVFKPLPDAVLSAKASLDTAARGLSLAELSLTALGLEATGGLEVERLFKDDWKVTVRLSVPGSDPKGLLSGLDLNPPKPSDPAVWGRLSGSCEATATAQGAVLSKLNLTLDQTEVQGQINVEGLERPRYVFALQAGTLDLDRYLPADKKKPEAEAKSGPRRRGPAEPLPLEALRRLNLAGSVAVKRFKYHRLTATDMRFDATAEKGRLNLNGLTADFYGGRLKADLSAKAVSTALNVLIDISGNGFSAGPFMKDLAGAEYIRGESDLWFELFSDGATDRDIVDHLDGDAGFRIRDGSYRFSKAPAQEGATDGRTGFKWAAANFKVKDGVFSNKDFKLDSTLFKSTGGGSFSLPEDSIDVTVYFDFVAAPDVPITMAGRLSDPEVRVPPGKMLTNTAKNILTLPQRSFRFLRDLLF